MKVLLLAAISVDGRIGLDADHFASWTSREDKQFFVEKTRESGAIIMGRKTFDTIGKPLPGRLNVIMTRDAFGTQSRLGELEYSSHSPREILQNLEGRGFESVVIGGGASIYSLFLKEDLVTDLFLTVEPILFGSGVPLVDGIDERKLNLESVQNLSGQTILLHYSIGPSIEYPYMPEGRKLKYVPFENPYMQAALNARAQLAGDPLWPNGAVLVKDGVVVASGGNGFSTGAGEAHICERVVRDCKSGEGYELCTL
ncbi:dihydrofolate reductase, partial [Patescibacteria group bacterium]|nr:dihydrofolate reductase [Patescibacteria group bacterium]